MDLYANKKIKITKNALTGKEILFLYDKHSDNIAGVNFKKDSLNKNITVLVLKQVVTQT